MSKAADRSVVTGAAGILGDALLRSDLFEPAVGVIHAHASPHESVRVDLRNREETFAALDHARPGVIVHTVALTDVDGCERDPATAYATSVLTTLNLAKWVRERSPGTLVVYISSDQVYSGEGPHEEDAVAPLNVYGSTKHAGELAAAHAGNALVLRTNFVGRSRGARTSYTDWIADTVRSARTITVDPRAVFSPLHLVDLVSLIHESARQRLVGTFNLGARDGIRKLELAREVAGSAAPHGEPRVVEMQPKNGARALRATDLRMDVSKLEAALGHRLPDTSRCLSLLRAETREAVTGGA